MISKPKFELTWIGKENQPKLDPRILIEDHGKFHHVSFQVSKKSPAAEGRNDEERLEAIS